MIIEKSDMRRIFMKIPTGTRITLVQIRSALLKHTAARIWNWCTIYFVQQCKILKWCTNAPFFTMPTPSVYESHVV